MYCTHFYLKSGCSWVCMYSNKTLHVAEIAMRHEQNPLFRTQLNPNQNKPKIDKKSLWKRKEMSSGLTCPRAVNMVT